MIRNIFVKNGNELKSYLVSIAEEGIKKVQEKIDFHMPKSDIQTGIFVNEKIIQNLLSEKEKVQIVEKSSIGDNLIFKYYICEVHPLSAICDDILNAATSIELSMAINELFNYIPQDENDLSYHQCLTNAIQFVKIDINFISNSKASSRVKKNILKTIQDSFVQMISAYETLEFSQDFEEAFKREISYQETQISEYKYTPEEIKMTRKRILNKLPDNKILK